MEFLLLAMLVSYYMTRNTVQDLAWKARGEDPPSYRREQERIRRREARKPITERREGRKFWANAWHDAWESAGEKRERIHNQRQERRRLEWQREDLADAEDEAHERNRRTPDDEQPQPRDEQPETEPKVVPEPDREPAEVPEPTQRCEMCETPVASWVLERRAVGHTLMMVCPSCAAYIEANPHPYGVPPEAPEPATPEPHHRPDGDPDAAPEPVPADAGDATGGAQIIQFADLQRPMKEETDMGHSGETPNLNAGLAYTQGMASTCLEGVTSVETSMANHRAGGVTGPTLDALAQAQELLSQAAAAFQTAHAALVRHIQVQEAYAANRDAGNKQFVTAD